MPGLFKRREPEAQTPRVAVQPPAPATQPDARPDLQIFSRELFQGFAAKEAAARADRQSELQTPAWKREMDGVSKALKSGLPPAEISLARENLSPREEVAGAQVALMRDMEAALNTAAPSTITQEQALRAKGALAMTQIAAALPIRDRGGWFSGAQESAMRIERTLETLPARMQHRRMLGLNDATLHEEEARELDGATAGLRDLGLRGLPRELQDASPAIRLADPVQANSDAKREAMLSYVQGIRFSLEEGGRETITTARDVMRGAATQASDLRKDPAVTPYLTLDQKTLGAFTKVRDAMLQDPKAGATITESQRPQLEASLGQVMDPAVAKALSGSAVASAGQIYESKEVRDMALFLNGDPAYMKPETHQAARNLLSNTPQVQRYRETATALMDSPTKGLSKAAEEFQQAAIDLEFVQPGAMATATMMGWGPLGVMAAAAKTRPNALEVREAMELATAMEKGGVADGYTRAFAPGSRTYMLPSEQPGEDPRVAHVSNNGNHVRVYGFNGREPHLAFEGPIAAAPIQEKVKTLLEESASVLTRPHARIKLAQAGLVDMQALPVPQHTRTPWLVDPLFQAPPLRDLQPVGDAAPVDTLDRNRLREAAAR